MPKKGNIRLSLSQKLDAQHKELVNIFLLRDPRVSVVDDPKDADYCVVNVYELGEINPLTFSVKKIIVLDFGDLYSVKVGLRQDDGQYRAIAHAFDLTFLYLEGENHPVKIRDDRTGYLKKLADGDDHFLKLSIPLGYPAGGKMNLNYSDEDTTAHHINNLTRNGKNYTYDFCWIAAKSSPWRGPVFRKLYNGYSGNGLWTNIISEQLETRCLEDVPPDSADCILVKSDLDYNDDIVEHRQNIHADNKTVPYGAFRAFHRESKVNISCRGISKWNYMDGEYFTWNCFNLRQYHEDLSYNPYSPVDGVHWVTFHEDNLMEKLGYYIQHDDERERINDAGYEYFKEGISGGWAKHYTDMFLAYLNSGSPHVFRKVLI